LVRLRASRNANEMIEEISTFGERIADTVARFGGSWTFIILFVVVLVIYTAINVALANRRLGPSSFYPAQPFPVDAGRRSSARHHDEPEPAGHEEPLAQ
jgi:hypothetical protein